MAYQQNPEKLQIGDRGQIWLSIYCLTALLLVTKRCAYANEWLEDIQLIKLPAFLQGPAASYDDSLDKTARESIGAFTTSPKRCFSPTAGQENFHRKVLGMLLKPC